MEDEVEMDGKVGMDGETPGAAVIDWAGLEAKFGGRSKFVTKLAATVLKAHAEPPTRCAARLPARSSRRCGFRPTASRVSRAP